MLKTRLQLQSIFENYHAFQNRTIKAVIGKRPLTVFGLAILFFAASILSENTNQSSNFVSSSQGLFTFPTNKQDVKSSLALPRLNGSILYQERDSRLSVEMIFLLVSGFIFTVVFVIAKERRVIFGRSQLRRLLANFERQKLNASIEAMLKGQEEERSRIAKDIHDGLGGMLSSLKYSLTNFGGNVVWKDDDLQAYRRSVELLDLSINEARKIAHNLMPELLNRFGLSESLCDFCQSMSSNACRVFFSSTGFEERISRDKEIVTYRIVQELLVNSIKHSYANFINVEVFKENGLVRINIEDNGKGFDTTILERSKSAGWINIRARTAYLCGEISLSSSLGRGTSVNILFHE